MSPFIARESAPSRSKKHSKTSDYSRIGRHEGEDMEGIGLDGQGMSLQAREPGAGQVGLSGLGARRSH